MNKTVLWVVIGAVVVVGGLMLMSNGSEREMGEHMEGDHSMVSGAFTGSGSIKCEYVQEGGITGTAYVKGGKVRIEGMANGGAVNVIYGDDQIYNWGEANGYAYGFMMEAPTADAQIEAGTQSLPSRADIESQFSSAGTRCENYNAPDSLFSPPADVKFQSMADLMKMMPKGY